MRALSPPSYKSISSPELTRTYRVKPMGVLKKPQKISKKTPKEPRVGVTAKAPRVFQFGTFLLDQNERVFLRDGKPVSLTPKVFDILSVLISNAGRMVTKDAILREVWPDTFVEEANLSVNI